MAPFVNYFTPFNSSFTLNIISYILLSLITALLSIGYTVEIVKRHPIKSESNSSIISGFTQGLLTALPLLFLNTFTITEKNEVGVNISYKAILFITGLSFTILSLKNTTKIMFEKRVLGLITLLSIISFCSYFMTNITFGIFYFFFSIFILFYIIKKLFSIPETFINEPTTVDLTTSSTLDLLSIILLPFDIIFENLIIISDTKRKVFSMPIFSKIFFSPITVMLICLYYTNRILNIKWLSVSLVCSLILSTLILKTYKKIDNNYVLNIYSAAVVLLIQYLLFDQLLISIKNISNILETGFDDSIIVFGVAIASFPSLCIQSSFIKRGFHGQTLYSLLYFPSISIYLVNLATFSFNSLNITMNYNNFIKSAFIGTIALVAIILAQIYKNNNRFSSNNWKLGIYTIVQDAIITIINNNL